MNEEKNDTNRRKAETEEKRAEDQKLKVTFECGDSILFRTQRVNTLSDLKSLILSKFGGTEVREIGRVTYRLLAPMGNGVFRFRLFRFQGDEHVQLMFDIHGRIMVEQVMELSAEVGHRGRGGSSDDDYVADSADSDSFDGGDEDEFVPETPVQTVTRHVLPLPHSIPSLSAVPSHYHSLDLDAMHERTPFSDTGEEDYNLDDGVEFRVGYRSAEYRMIESDQLKYHVQCCQADNGCQWSLRVAFRQNLRYWEVLRVGGAHSCVAPIMSQDHRHLDSSMIYRVILPLIQSNSSVSIPVLQGAVQASYHFKPSYRKVWMEKQKAITQIYGDLKESYTKVPKLLQALQNCFL
ncbi:uncharacterized protein LOC130934756 [Arachis stenosperma]|uniref:uncharacterized protein LOC130934756 n=1 Tax=Arachis stenosperma TaxID=217475 RepID=UPI0025ABBB14|nr:uncharacterized protein LOC130934756 [Arachis stenosperma]